MAKEPRVCKLCGDLFNHAGYYCQSCSAYLRLHPEGLYPQPEYREVLYADNGDPVCHICRKAYRKLGNHIKFKHHIDPNVYKERYGLTHNTRLCNQEYVEKMREYNIENWDVVVSRNLIEMGKGTRVSKDNILPARKIGNNQIQHNIVRIKGVK